jgi:hypothetical protein
VIELSGIHRASIAGRPGSLKIVLDANSTTSRSPSFAIASISVVSALAGACSSCSSSTVGDLVDGVNDHTDGFGAALDDHDLALLAGLAGDAKPGGQVIDGQDSPAQAQHAADRGFAGGDRPGLFVADDLVHLLDRQGVLLTSEGEHDELTRLGLV